MQITLNSVAQFHYVLKDADGSVLESSEGGEPMTYLHGHGGLLPGDAVLCLPGLPCRSSPFSQ